MAYLDVSTGSWLPLLDLAVWHVGHNSLYQDGDFDDVAAAGDNVEFLFLDHATSGVVLYVHPRKQGGSEGAWSTRLWL
jgi:hypothetical protein